EGESENRVLDLDQFLEEHRFIIDAVHAGDAAEVFRSAGVDVVDAKVAFLTGASAGDRELAIGEEEHRMSALGAGEDAARQFAGGNVPHGQLMVAANDDLFAV